MNNYPWRQERNRAERDDKNGSKTSVNVTYLYFTLELHKCFTHCFYMSKRSSKSPSKNENKWKTNETSGRKSLEVYFKWLQNTWLGFIFLVAYSLEGRCPKRNHKLHSVYFLLNINVDIVILIVSWAYCKIKQISNTLMSFRVKFFSVCKYIHIHIYIHRYKIIL
jgi:hypothetical protein